MTDSATAYPAPGAADEMPRFSWHRIMQLAALYSRPLRTQWLIYAIAIPLIYLGMVFLPDWADGLLTLVMSVLTLGAPLVFAMRDRTLVRLAPVTGAERLTFYLLYTFIFVPVVMEIYFYAFQGIGSLISPMGNVRPDISSAIAKAASAGLTLSDAVVMGIGSYSISVLVIGTTIYGALTGKSPVKAAILYGAGTYAAVMVVTTIAAAVIGFMSVSELAADHELTASAGEAISSDFVNFMPWLMLALGMVSLLLFVLLCVKLYRRLR